MHYESAGKFRIPSRHVSMTCDGNYSDTRAKARHKYGCKSTQ